MFILSDDLSLLSCVEIQESKYLLTKLLIRKNLLEFWNLFYNVLNDMNIPFAKISLKRGAWKLCYDGDGMMVCDGISLTGKTKLVITGGKVIADKYWKEILQSFHVSRVWDPTVSTAALPPSQSISDTASRIWELRGWNGPPAILTSAPPNTC